MRIAIIGEHRHRWTLPANLAKAAEDMGHKVTAINEATWDGSLEAGSEFIIYSPIMGRGPEHDIVRARFAECDRAGIPVVSWHLDLFPRMPRESEVPSHPMFSASLVVTTDADEDFWRAKGINHLHMLPGVDEYACRVADQDKSLRHDVVFVGARSVPGYPARTAFLEAIEREVQLTVYEHGSGMRGSQLAALYASARVVLGDSVLAGEVPGYTSDRLYETLGRGGRLVYPEIEGVTFQPQYTNLVADYAPCRRFEPGDTVGAVECVVAALNCDAETERKERLAAVAWAKAGHTYRHRLEALLAHLGRAR